MTDLEALLLACLYVLSPWIMLALIAIAMRR